MDPNRHIQPGNTVKKTTGWLRLLIPAAGLLVALFFFWPDAEEDVTPTEDVDPIEDIVLPQPANVPPVGPDALALKAARTELLQNAPRTADLLRKEEDLDGLLSLAHELRGEYVEDEVWKAVIVLLVDRGDLDELLALPGLPIHMTAGDELSQRTKEIASAALINRWRNESGAIGEATAAEYLRRFPENKEGVAAIEEHYWRKTRGLTFASFVENPQPYETYLRILPDGPNAKEARRFLDEASAWERAKNTNTLQSYAKFMNDWPVLVNQFPARASFLIHARTEWVKLRLKACNAYTSRDWPDSPPGVLPGPAMVVQPDSGYVMNPHGPDESTNWTHDVTRVRVLVVTGLESIVFVDLLTDRVLGTWSESTEFELVQEYLRALRF